MATGGKGEAMRAAQPLPNETEENEAKNMQR